jgi:hypothetical protein
MPKTVPINLNDREDELLHETVKDEAKRTGRNVTALTKLLWQKWLDEEMAV